MADNIWTAAVEGIAARGMGADDSQEGGDSAGLNGGDGNDE